jgi:hypothetical protein
MQQLTREQEGSIERLARQEARALATGGGCLTRGGCGTRGDGTTRGRGVDKREAAQES